MTQQKLLVLQHITAIFEAVSILLRDGKQDGSR
jgi:hypothetical protein